MNRGYLQSATNPNFSGLTKLVFRDTPDMRPETVYTTCYIESGHGMRQLCSVIGRNGELVQESGRIPLEYEIDDLGLLMSFTVEEVPA